MAPAQSHSPIQTPALQRRRWRVSGRVQGVGFRPFVHRIAHEHRLSGFVLNDSAGVVIEAQGSATELNAFASDLRSRRPPLAVIHELTAVTIEPHPAEADFVIAESRAEPRARAEVAPDIAVCPECLAELRDPVDQRRVGFGLINCTNCGPRFSIIRQVPYDRPSTTMADFPMCDDCLVEYSDPRDRRFHAQPTACNACGPRVELVGPRGNTLAGDPIQQSAELLAQGKIVAVKGIGGFHLAVRADDEQAVQRLRQIKHRLFKPFALMCQTLADARRIVQLSDLAAEMLIAPAAPIVLAPRATEADIAPSVAPGNHRLGVMLAYTPIHHLLFDAANRRFTALVMTSANDSDEPLIYTHDDAREHLAGMCDAILWHQRPIERPVDDSIILDGQKQEPIVLRRSRGYVPTPVRLPEGCRSAGLCVGGELKSTVAVVRDGEAILSQHLGDLGHARTYANFKREVEDLLRLFSVTPQWIAHDMHPSYVSTMYAAQLSKSLHIPRVRLQHHHAHAAAVLAEHGQVGPALAVVLDGTGFGTDNTIWGGELLAVDLRGFKRLGHLRPIRLAGGDAAAKQPWRSALALLYNAFGEQFIDHAIVPHVVPEMSQAQFIAQMFRTRTNCWASSSAGRVFDGVAALLGLCHENHFEAQAPMALESAAANFGDAPRVKQPLHELADVHGGGISIDLSPLVRELVHRRLHRAPAEELSALFHDQFAAAWEAAVVRAVEQTGLICVALSGGVLCNQIVDEQLTSRLTRRGLHVLRHRQVPPNDGGLALGQAALAAYRNAKGIADKLR